MKKNEIAEHKYEILRLAKSYCREQLLDNVRVIEVKPLMEYLEIVAGGDLFDYMPYSWITAIIEEETEYHNAIIAKHKLYMAAYPLLQDLEELINKHSFK